jgi:hypothetical protein
MFQWKGTSQSRSGTPSPRQTDRTKNRQFDQNRTAHGLPTRSPVTSRSRTAPISKDPKRRVANLSRLRLEIRQVNPPCTSVVFDSMHGIQDPPSSVNYLTA